MKLTDYRPVTRYVEDDAIRSVGERLLDCTLPKAEWTHAAHFAATIYFLLERPDLDLSRDLPKIITRYNESTGTANTDHSGYHETLTQFYVRAIRRHLSYLPTDTPLIEAHRDIMTSALGDKAYPLRFYSEKTLFSVAARHRWIEPDLRALDEF